MTKNGKTIINCKRNENNIDSKFKSNGINKTK